MRVFSILSLILLFSLNGTFAQNINQLKQAFDQYNGQKKLSIHSKFTLISNSNPEANITLEYSSARDGKTCYMNWGEMTVVFNDAYRVDLNSASQEMTVQKSQSGMTQFLAFFDEQVFEYMVLTKIDTLPNGMVYQVAYSNNQELASSEFKFSKQGELQSARMYLKDSNPYKQSGFDQIHLVFKSISQEVDPELLNLKSYFTLRKSTIQPTEQYKNYTLTTSIQ